MVIVSRAGGREETGAAKFELIHSVEFYLHGRKSDIIGLPILPADKGIKN